ncbi:hypothetical protein A4A49_03079 [Nicotiana attenuata]|uniref:DUF4283 domain-containing protein n=1 Tax=Nicotiana attenuata TaxID=49451 RepID=A0A1J6HWZ4_NICAT|nr:hypothetical protein A4A49_03079 [Nicotiana attenuata]
MSFIKASSWPALELGGRCHRKLDVGQEPHFSLSEEHTLRRKGFLESFLIGSFSKWVGSPEVVRNWAAEAWDVKDGLKISQLGDTQYLFRFVDESQASEILVKGNRWFDGNLKLDRWVEHDGCLGPRLTSETLVVNMVGLPVHLWCLDLFEKIGEICGGFIDVTSSLHNLSRVRIVVRKGGKIPVSKVVEDGYLSYRVWLNSEFRPILMPVIVAEEKGRSNRREGQGNQSLRGGEGSPDWWAKQESEVRSRRDGGFEFGRRRHNFIRRKRGECPGDISSPSSSVLRPSSMAVTSRAAPAKAGGVIPRPPASDGPNSIAPSSSPVLSCAEVTLQAPSSGEIVAHAPVDVSAGPAIPVNMPPRVPCSLSSCCTAGVSGHPYSSGVLISEVGGSQGNGEILSAPKVPIASNVMVLYSFGMSKEKVHVEDACPISSRIRGGDMSFWMEDKLLNFEKENLRKLVLSTEWKENSYAKEADFVRALKVGGPLIKVLRMVDGEIKQPMGYLYEAIDRAKETIEASFEGDLRKYEKVFENMTESGRINLIDLCMQRAIFEVVIVLQE